MLLLSGEGGVGKTTIASRYYHKYEDSYTHMIWAVNQNKIDDTLLSLAMYLQIKLDEKKSKEEQIKDLLKILEKFIKILERWIRL